MELTGKTILFVEDRPDSVMGFRNALKRRGATTRIKRNINSALRELSSGNFDLVVIDLFLPNDYDKLKASCNRVTMNGNNQGELLACYLREQDDSVPYLYLTSMLEFYSGNENDLVFLKSADQINTFIKKIEEL